MHCFAYSTYPAIILTSGTDAWSYCAAPYKNLSSKFMYVLDFSALIIAINPSWKWTYKKQIEVDFSFQKLTDKWIIFYPTVEHILFWIWSRSVNKWGSLININKVYSRIYDIISLLKSRSIKFRNYRSIQFHTNIKKFTILSIVIGKKHCLSRRS